jgi:hypothetical protein
MTSQRAKSMHQASLWTLGTAQAPGKTAQATDGFPRTRQSARASSVN